MKTTMVNELYSYLEKLDLKTAKEKIDYRISYISDKSYEWNFWKEIEELKKIRQFITDLNNSDIDKKLVYFFWFELFSANDSSTNKSDRNKISSFIMLNFNENKE